MKKAIIIIIAVLVILVGVFCGLFFLTDTFNFLKPASNNFSMQAKKLMGTDEDPKYSEYEDFLNKLKSGSSNSTDLNMNMNLNVPNSVMNYSTQRLINSSSIKYKGSYDANSKAMLNNIGLYKDNNEVLTLSTVAKDQSFSVSCKDLYDKYLTFDLSKYESFCKANNITVDAETKQTIDMLSKLKNTDSNNFIYDLFYISEEDFNSLHKNYDDILQDLIDKENYKTNKNQKISVNGEDVKTTAYSLTLSGEDSIDFVNKLVDLIKNDSTFKKLIIEKYNIMVKYSNSLVTAASDIDNDTISGMPSSTKTASNLPELTESQLDKFLSDLVEDLEDAKDDLNDEDQCIRLTIYSDKKSEPVKFEMAILDDKDDDEGSVIFTEELSKGKTTYTIDLEQLSKSSDDGSSVDNFSRSNSNSLYNNTTNSTGLNSSSLYNNTTNSSRSSLSNATSSLDTLANSISKIIIEDSYEETEDSRKGTITLSAKSGESRTQDMFEIKYDTVNSDSEAKFNISVTSPQLSSISFDLVSEVTGLDTDTQKVNFSLSGKYSAYSIKVAMDGSVKSGAEVPELNDSNSVDIFASSKENLQTVYTDIITKAADVLPARLSPYGVKITKEEILSALPQSTATPESGAATDPNAVNVEQPAA